MSEWISPRDVFGKPGSKPYMRATRWLRNNANHKPKIDSTDRKRILYHQDDIAAYERNYKSHNLAGDWAVDWFEMLKPYLDTPRTPGAISYSLFVYDGKNLNTATIKNWLERFVKSGQVVRTGIGVRNDPYRYQLAEVVDA